ncbi:MAG TPA: hypothetical protein VFK52_09135 [Nocardioidaceae bacterium]|nr:hypothetical protein [Nocardioidaceae bacterium]
MDLQPLVDAVADHDLLPEDLDPTLRPLLDEALHEGVVFLDCRGHLETVREPATGAVRTSRA